MLLTTIERLLQAKIGLSVDTVGADTIASAVRRRMDECGIRDDGAYLEYLASSSKEWDELIEAVIVPETWFFRNAESFTFLGRYIKSEWILKNNNNKLRALSVPCSTGEEPYSMAMTFLDAGLPHDRFSIDAVDISNKGLNKAKQGVYGQESFRNQDMLPFRDQYFTSIAGGYQIDSSIKQSVQFVWGNLLNDKIFSDAKPYDIIFCRNLLIYLTPSAIKTVISFLDRLLTEAGILFVGHAERPLFQASKFTPITIPGVFAYYRTGQLDECRICHQSRRKTERFERRKRLRKIAPSEKSPLEGSQEGVSLEGPILSPSTESTLKSSAPLRVDSIDGGQRGGTSKRGTINNNQLSPVFIEHRRTPDTSLKMLDIARELADQGNLKEALKMCGEVLAKSATHVQAYFLMGLIYQALKNDTQAEECFHKTIYLDPNHHEALYYLALINEERGEHNTAKQLRQRIQRIYQRTQRD
jgi:chemotaxis protein methyltransferase WspC